MIFPNYKNRSIVNLMSTIGKAFGYISPYGELSILKGAELASCKNIVLIVIDGLGYDFLKEKGLKSTCNANLCGKITSVFPSSTTSCVTTFHTGVAPQQHAVTGWYTYLKELGVVAKILRFSPRFGNMSFGKGITANKIFNQKTFIEKIKASSYIVTHKDISDTDYTIAHSYKAKRFYYSNIAGFFNGIKMALQDRKSRKFVYAYWPEFDTICHDYGVKSKKAYANFKRFDSKLASFIKAIQHTNTAVIVTADHGMIDGNEKCTVRIEHHKKLLDALALPLCGEPRAAYCYVRPFRRMQFEKYVKTKLKKFCSLHKSDDLIRKNVFGLFSPNEKLHERVGDYILLMKKNCVIRDTILGEKKKHHIGNHGGVSSEEMYVPLIMIKTDGSRLKNS